MMRSVFLHLSRHPEYKTFLERFALTRIPFDLTARQFIAGDTLDDAVDAVKDLNSNSMSATMDFLGESVNKESDACNARDNYCALLDRINSEGLNSHISIKLTQLGLDINPSFVRQNLDSILARAEKYDNFVRIDMESSKHVPQTLEIYKEMRKKYPADRVGVVLQSMLHRTDKDMMQLLEYSPSIRLVKGAYKEPQEIAFQNMAQIRLAFIRQAKALLYSARAKGNVKAAFATHDVQLIENILSEKEHLKIDSQFYEFQMLYGFSPSVQKALCDRGEPVRIYVPFGKCWWPYFMRRLAERPQNVMFFAKHLLSKDTFKGVFRKKRAD